jgi:hypothetical protein
MEIGGLLGLLVVVLIAEGIAICLRRPLALLLRVEKGSERAEFWNTYIRIVLLLVPAAFALMSFPSSPVEDPLFGALVGQLRWGLAGILITLAAAGHAVRVAPPARPHTSPYAAPVMPAMGNGPVR